MTSPQTTRRMAVLAVAVVCAIVLAGLGWATQSAVQLQRYEGLMARKEALDKSFDEKRALALSKLDAVVAPVLARELARPYEHFRPFYKPFGAIDERSGADVSAGILVPSPLRTLRGPEWILLHFQATETDEREKWSSPQIEDDYRYAPPVWALAATEPERVAHPENWLETLNERYQPLELLQKLEESFGASQAAFSPSDRSAAGPGANPQTGSPGADVVGPTRTSRSAAEFIRRGARLVQLQVEATPADVCCPEPVAFANLETGPPSGMPAPAATDCVPVSSTPMRPIWLKLMTDGRMHLAFVRSVSVETAGFCTLQGVLIDWQRLRRVLEAEVKDLFPEGAIVPVTDYAAVQPGLSHTLMQTIPARLDTGDPPRAAPPELSSGFKVGLGVAWSATILALAAIAYGTLKYVTLAERRMRFVSAVTHELRTPLTSFQLYSDLLADMPREDAEVRRGYARTLCDESHRLARLVENVLAYSRIGATAPSLNWTTVSPQDLLNDVRRATEEHCRNADKECTIENHCPADARIQTDPEFVQQILTNLVENACKYSAGAEDPRIWLSAAPTDDGMIAFEVDDSGSGVAANDRRAIFQPFRRGNSTGVKLAGGVGLGLALSRYWASCLGGSLMVRRSPRNHGRYSSFVLTLPVQRTARGRTRLSARVSRLG